MLPSDEYMLSILFRGFGTTGMLPLVAGTVQVGIFFRGRLTIAPLSRFRFQTHAPALPATTTMKVATTPIVSPRGGPVFASAEFGSGAGPGFTGGLSRASSRNSTNSA